MKSAFKCVPALVLGLYAMQVQTAERLVGISDETAPVVNPSEPPADREDGIVYRVICAPEGEKLPECEQPPVKDSFKAAPPQSGAVVPDMPGGGDNEPDDTQKPVTTREPAKGSLKPAASKKAASLKKDKKDKKDAKKSVKKTASKTSNKTAKPEKKRKRR